MLKTHCALALAAAAAASIAAPAYAAETITVPFTTPSTATSDLYSGIVRITISGTGQSAGQNFNDAFYKLPNGGIEPNGKYQLGFSTSPLTPEDGAFAAYQNVVGGRPAFRADGIYTFLLNTGVATPSKLYFGVTDGNFRDNSGAFTLSLSTAGVPEPATWALMILGFGAVGAALRRRRRAVDAKISLA